MAFKTKHGSWRVQWREGAKKCSRKFPNAGMARKFEAELRLDLVAIETIIPMTFEQHAQDWYSDYCMINKSPTQWDGDRSIIGRYLIPEFGFKKLPALALHDLVKLQAKLLREVQLKPKTVNNIVGLARKIVEDAVAWGRIAHNPFARINPLRIEEQPYQFWTYEEARRFCNVAKFKAHELYEVVAFTLNTGLRLGEVQGLYRDCIDYDRGLISVRRNYNAKTGRLFEFTKSKRIRHVPANKLVLEILNSRKLMGADQTVFSLSFHNMKRRLTRLCRKAEVRPIRFHDLRHTFASHLAMKGVPLIKIKELLGHGDFKTTLRYAHLSPDSFTGITDCLIEPTNLQIGTVLAPFGQFSAF